MTAKRLRDSAFVLMVFGAILAFLTVPGHARDEEGCTATLYTCTESCTDVSGAAACAEECGDDYIPNAVQSGSCLVQGGGNCDPACGLEDCYGKSWGCHLPLD